MLRVVDHGLLARPLDPVIDRSCQVHESTMEVVFVSCVRAKGNAFRFETIVLGKIVFDFLALFDICIVPRQLALPRRFGLLVHKAVIPLIVVLQLFPQLAVAELRQRIDCDLLTARCGNSGGKQSLVDCCQEEAPSYLQEGCGPRLRRLAHIRAVAKNLGEGILRSATWRASQVS